MARGVNNSVGEVTDTDVIAGDAAERNGMPR